MVKRRVVCKGGKCRVVRGGAPARPAAAPPPAPVAAPIAPPAAMAPAPTATPTAAPATAALPLGAGGIPGAPKSIYKPGSPEAMREAAMYQYFDRAAKASAAGQPFNEFDPGKVPLEIWKAGPEAVQQFVKQVQEAGVPDEVFGQGLKGISDFMIQKEQAQQDTGFGPGRFEQQRAQGGMAALGEPAGAGDRRRFGGGLEALGASPMDVSADAISGPWKPGQSWSSWLKGLGQGVWEGIFGEHPKVLSAPRFTPGQYGLLGDVVGQARNTLAENPYSFEPIAKRARQQFQEETLPSIAERFAGKNALQSSAFNRAGARAGSDLETGLAALQSQQALQRMPYINQLAGVGLTEPKLTNLLAGNTGLLGGVVEGVAKGVGSKLGH